MASADSLITALIHRWRDDPGSTYRSWFLWDDRLKNFRSIRTGLGRVVEEIDQGTFGTRYKGSSLETVVGSIAEQRQMFKGADHAFLWKPKLRIPDIYENRDHQRAFGQFLDRCCCCSAERDVLAAIRTIDARNIKGLGPAAANLLYFLHPTIVCPFNTAIVKGYNALLGARVKLGRWDEYLAMRDGVLRLNDTHGQWLSNDLGAAAGLLYDIGSGRYAPPPRDDDAEARAVWEADLARVRAASQAPAVSRTAADERSHTEIQGWLRDLGHALGFDVHIAANDRAKPWLDGLLGDGCLPALPPELVDTPGHEAVRLIDVLWFERGTAQVAAAFEVEHTTSIYSGIVRMLDLALGVPDRIVRGLFLVAPDNREADVRAQLQRPAFRHIDSLHVRYLPYGELAAHRATMARFGQGLKPIEAIARRLS